jgi:hypothetical protein
MLQCSSCGSNLRPTARICIKCGHAITDDERKKALQQDATLATSTSIPPLFSSDPSDSDLQQDSTQVKDVAGPVFSSPVGEIISPPVKPRNVTNEPSSPPLDSSGLTKQHKKMAAIAVGVLMVAIFIFGLTSVTSKKDIPAAPTPSITPAIPAPPVVVETPEQKVSGPIDLKNIRPVLAPAQTSGLLTDMLLNNSNSVKLLELKAKIEEIYPKPERGDRKAARALNDQALLAFRQENYSQAASIFSEALKSDPSDIEVLNNYAYALLKGGRYLDAERILGFVLSIAPGRTSGWANLADVYANTNRPDAASAGFVVGFRFATNQDKALAFLKDRAETEPNENIRRAVINALAQLSQ